MAAYAALASLMRTIHDLEHHPSPPISLDKQQVESITQRITYFQEFLQAYNSPTPAADNEEEAADPLEMRIAGAAYAAEDAIESRIVDRIHYTRSNFCSKIVQILNFFQALREPNLCRAIKEMDSIKKLVDVKVKTEKKVSVVHNQVAMTNDLASVDRNETMVGTDAVLLEIMEKLTGGRPDLQVIPIVGMGGIGKTTLARSIYAQPLMKECFYICAWVTISQQYNIGEILSEVLSKATMKEKELLTEKSVDVLGSELHKYLFGRRFLIVMDDMWSIDAWDKIQRFFPNNENGSRVLVTTRLSQLSSQLNNNYSLHMSFLDKDSSWDLFSKTVFTDKSCPRELMKIGEKIVDNCRGLPLSIVVVGGLLRKMDSTQESWKSVRDNLTSVVNTENDKHCLRLLKLSYNYLPVYLKPCFLYLGLFEEDNEIRVSTLVKLWVSEGFLKPTEGEVMETTARGCLQDLIDRNLLLISRLRSSGSIKFCKVHDLVRDMCLKEYQKEGFFHVIGQCNPPLQGMNNQLRVVIPRNTSMKKVCDELRCMPNARSVTCESDMLQPCMDMGLLRTLHARNGLGYYNGHMNSLACRCVNLRHLAIVYSGDMSLFLPSASLLWNLHTLIVSCSSDPYLLVDFWKMPQFRHIEFDNECVCLSDPPSDGDAVVIMENLHTLKGIGNFKCSEEVVKRIPNIRRLKLEYNIFDALFIKENPHLPERTMNVMVKRNPNKKRFKLRNHNNHDHDYSDMDEYCGNVKYLRRLESLSIVVRGTTAHIQKLTFPHSLKKLSLQISFSFDLEDGILEMIGSLPLLEKLRLNGGGFWKEGEWRIVEDQFPCLKHLELWSCRGLKHWTAAEEGSNILSCLEYLFLCDLEELENIPCELGDIDTLTTIQLIDCGERVAKSAKEMVDEQVESQGVEQISLCVQDNPGRYRDERSMEPYFRSDW